MKKYEYTDEVSEFSFYNKKYIVHRIRALVDIPSKYVKKGDLGGFIDDEATLSHKGDAWIGDDAVVFNNSIVCDNAWVRGSAFVSSSTIQNNSVISDNVRLESCTIVGKTRMYSNARAIDSFLIDIVATDDSTFIDSNVYNSKFFKNCNVSNSLIKFGCYGKNVVIDKSVFYYRDDKGILQPLKYTLDLNDTDSFKETITYRVRALKSFGSVRALDYGGWVQSEQNLSQEGNAWVADNAHVANDARVFGDAVAKDNAFIIDMAKLCNEAVVGGNSVVSGIASVKGCSKIDGNSHLTGGCILDNAFGTDIFIDSNEVFKGQLMPMPIINSMDDVKDGMAVKTRDGNIYIRKGNILMSNKDGRNANIVIDKTYNGTMSDINNTANDIMTVYFNDGMPFDIMDLNHKEIFKTEKEIYSRHKIKHIVTTNELIRNYADSFDIEQDDIVVEDIDI